VFGLSNGFQVVREVIVDGVARDGAVDEALCHRVVSVGIVRARQGVEQRFVTLADAPQSLNFGAQVLDSRREWSKAHSRPASLQLWQGSSPSHCKWSESASHSTRGTKWMRGAPQYTNGCLVAEEVLRGILVFAYLRSFPPAALAGHANLVSTGHAALASALTGGAAKGREKK